MTTVSPLRVAGFALVELLVVISIIGILSSVLYANFSTSREVARDKVRQADLHALQLAIELYKEQNGTYPEAGCGASVWAGPGPASLPNFASCDEYIDGLVPEFIAALPEDPSREADDNRGYYYRTNAANDGYKLMSHLSAEEIFITAHTDEFARCPTPTASTYCGAGSLQQATYAVYSRTGADW